MSFLYAGTPRERALAMRALAAAELRRHRDACK